MHMIRPAPWSLFIILLCCLTSNAESASVFSIERFQLKESLDSHSEVLASPLEELADILALPEDTWRPAADDLSFAAGGTHVWMKSTLQNRLQVPVQVTVRLTSPFFAQARFFALDQGVLVAQTHVSPETSNRFSMDAIRPGHTLTLEPGATRMLLLSVESHAFHDMHWEIWDAESHVQESLRFTLRWIFLLALLFLLSLFTGMQGLVQKRGVPLALSLFTFLSLLFLVRMTHWPLPAMFWEPLAGAMPPLNGILCAMHASLLLLARMLTRSLQPARLIQASCWLVLCFLVLGMSLMAVLHWDQSLLFLPFSEAVLLALLLFWHHRAMRQHHHPVRMLRLLLAQQGILLTIHVLALLKIFPLPWLPETWLWLQASVSLWFAFWASSADRSKSPLPHAALSSEPLQVSASLPDKNPSPQLREQWLLAEKMAALGTFTNGLANELNNPLAIIAGHRYRLSSMMDNHSFNLREFEKSLGKIDHAVNRMIAVIDALKVYSQDPQGQEVFKTFSLRETIKYTIDLCRDKVTSRGIRLSTPELNDATMEGHQGQIIQVLLVLIDNAIDALELAPEKAIRIELQPLPDTLRLAVIDSGPGVPLELRNRIWDPFFTSKDPFRHKGLGLSIAIGIISNHRGRILLDETSAETRFVVELPRTHTQKVSSQQDSGLS